MYVLKKAFRVKSERDFQKIFHAKNSCANRNFVCYSLEKGEQKHFRVGISVGKRVSKKAVVRNAIKRKIRQSVFELKDEISPTMDFILIARPSTINLNKHEIKQNIIHVLKLANLINEKTEREEHV